MFNLNRKKLIINLILFIASILIYLAFMSIDRIVMNAIKTVLKGVRDIPLYILYITLWSAVKYSVIGLAIGIIAIPFMYFIVSRLLALEVIVERKLKISNVALFDKYPKIGIFNLLIYAYILFAPIIILVRILSGGEASALLYVDMLSIVLPNMHYILLFLLTFYILRDLSRVRELKGSLLVAYPSKILFLIFTIIVWIGSITALVPIFYDILNHIKEPSLSMSIFIMLILNGYIPPLIQLLFFLMILKYNDEYFKLAISKFESIVERYASPVKIKIE